MGQNFWSSEIYLKKNANEYLVVYYLIRSELNYEFNYKILRLCLERI